MIVPLVMVMMTFAATPDELVDAAPKYCKNAAKKVVDRQLLSKLLEIEAQNGVPGRLRGMTLAAACHESGFSRDAVGDNGKAIGWFQLHPWWERYGVDRRDPISSANAWVARIAANVKRAKKKKCSDPWVSAWAYVASGPKGWRCRAPRHWTLLKKWKRKIAREKR